MKAENAVGVVDLCDGVEKGDLPIAAINLLVKDLNQDN